METCQLEIKSMVIPTPTPNTGIQNLILMLGNMGLKLNASSPKINTNYLILGVLREYHCLLIIIMEGLKVRKVKGRTVTFEILKSQRGVCVYVQEGVCRRGIHNTTGQYVQGCMYIGVLKPPNLNQMI